MRACLVAIFALGCTRPAPGFEIQGSVAVGAADRGSVIALWTLRREPPQLYKWGDGSSIETAFSIGFDELPPEGAIDADGVGVAILVQLPDLATIPDGVVDNPDTLRASGISADHALVWRRGVDATGPAWATSLPLAYSCVRCVHSTSGGLDTYELAPCLEFTIQRPTADTCNWY